MAANTGDADELINLMDFKSINLDVTKLQNSTTRTVIKDDKTTPKKEILFLEFTEEGLVLQIPQRSCAKGHQLLMNMAVTGTQNDFNLNATAVVEALEENEDIVTAHLKLMQFDESDWEQLRDIYSNRQEEIQVFFESIRG